VTRETFTLDAAGNRGIIVFPNAKSKIALSGASTYGTWTFQDDALYSELSGGDYAYLRQVAMCVKVVPQQPTTEAAPVVRSWCGPRLSTSDRTASGTGIDDKPTKTHVQREEFEVGWCARESADFSPYDPTEAPGASAADIRGLKLTNRPAIHLEMQGGAASGKFSVIVTTIYECFYDENQQFKPSVPSPTNSHSVDLIVNGIRNLTWSRDGSSAINRVAGYGAKVSKFIKSPAAQAAWAVGKPLLLSMM
jgi:hypothetical protein